MVVRSRSRGGRDVRVVRGVSSSWLFGTVGNVPKSGIVGTVMRGLTRLVGGRSRKMSTVPGRVADGPKAPEDDPSNTRTGSGSGGGRAAGITSIFGGRVVRG